jgi:3-isopropylmalate dehydrogenase
MMFKYSFGYAKEGDLIEKAVENILNSGVRTADIAKAGEARVSCSEMGDEIIRELQKFLA